MSKDNEQMQQHSELLDEIAHQVSLEQEQTVPEWNRAAAFENSASRFYTNRENLPWWHWQHNGALAFAASVSVIAVLSIFFNQGDSFDQQKMATLIKAQVVQQLDIEVERKLREFASEQQVVLANYKAELSARQEQSNLQLAGYVMTTTRTERKEDLNDFVSFISAQRKDQQLDQKIRFQQLEQAIGYRKVNYRQDVSNTKSTSNQ